MRIESFTGQFRWLSNFWPCFVTLDGITYPTVEHAYQAAKTLDTNLRTVILNCVTPGIAKREARKLVLRIDWPEIKLGVMADLVHQKFMNDTKLAQALIRTQGLDLIEGNTWGDKYWGVCNGVGENHLGKILMEVREGLLNG